MIEPSGAPPPRVWGLDNIAKALGVSLRTLQRMLAWPRGERPPVRHCHRGYYAWEVKLRQWVDANDMDAGVYRELVSRGEPELDAAGSDEDDEPGAMRAGQRRRAMA